MVPTSPSIWYSPVLHLPLSVGAGTSRTQTRHLSLRSCRVRLVDRVSRLWHSVPGPSVPSLPHSGPLLRFQGNRDVGDGPHGVSITVCVCYVYVMCVCYVRCVCVLCVCVMCGIKVVWVGMSGFRVVCGWVLLYTFGCIEVL